VRTAAHPLSVYKQYCVTETFVRPIASSDINFGTSAENVGSSELTNFGVCAMVLNSKTIINLAITTAMIGLVAWASATFLMKSDSHHVVGVVEIGEVQ